MSEPGAAARPESERARRWSPPLLVMVAALAPAVVILGLATGAWPMLALAAGVVAIGAVSLVEIRAAFLVAVLIGSFVDYNTGHLAIELAIVCAWLAWTSLLLAWRGALRGWVRPPAAMMPGLLVWLGACAFGVALGLLRGNRLENIGVELAAALWPALGLGILQAYDRRGLVYAGLGMVVIALIHTGFGLTMLGIYQQRLGGIYFTTVTGFVAVGLWTTALLAPTRKVRAFCLLAMVPLLAHLLFSFTRGYWLGFMAGLAVATALAWRNLGRFERAARPRRLLLIPALLAVLAATLGISALVFGGAELLAAIGGRLGSSFSTQAGRDTLSNVIRLAEYDRAIGAALGSPIIGHGFGFTIVTRDPFFGQIKEQWFVHNYYLLLWLKLGIVGLAAFGYLIVRFVREARRAADEESDWLVRAWSIAAIAMTCQLLTILLTNYSVADVTTAFPFAFVWGVFWAARSGHAGTFVAKRP